MMKKLGLMLAISAIVAAVAAPAFANAATGFKEGGVLIPVGSKLDYTGLEIFKITSSDSARSNAHAPQSQRK